jgi:stage V sporulation protein K
MDTGLLRDEAIQLAKAHGDEAVEPRHVLAALLKELGDRRPKDLDQAFVSKLLGPEGSGWQTPKPSDAAEALLAELANATPDQTVEIAKRVAAALPDAGAGTGTGTGKGSGPKDGTSTADAGSAAVEHPSGDGSTSASTATQTADGTPSIPETKESTKEILAELDALVGLASAKAAIHRVIAVQALNAERRAKGLPVVGASWHMVFIGPAGTGKTTVARIVARLYGSMGLLSRGHLVETGRADLVAGYVGQTAIKVQEAVDRALGGVLFIDEAYALAGAGDNDFGAEAIATLVKLMEDHRADLAVIVAGYPDEMRVFIESNPGLRSRFTTYVQFDDYAVDELMEIFSDMAAKAQVDLGPGVTELARANVVVAMTSPNFGNARYVRGLFEEAYGRMAARVMADGTIDAAELSAMTQEDVPTVISGMVMERPTIGFRPA